jgi:hypothetical protein
MTHGQISAGVTLTLITGGISNNQKKNSVGIQVCNKIILKIILASCNGKYTW